MQLLIRKEEGLGVPRQVREAKTKSFVVSIQMLVFVVVLVLVERDNMIENTQFPSKNKRTRHGTTSWDKSTSNAIQISMEYRN